MWFVTHKNSKPTKSRKHWDFLAICADKAEAERLVKEVPGATGAVEAAMLTSAE